LFSDLTILPCYRWHRVIVVPRAHPLAEVAKPTFKQLAAYSIITYTFSFSGPSSLQQAFAKAGVTPDVAITARDADVIKTYVRLGLGIGIVAEMAVDPREDSDLVAIDASHLLASHVTWVGFRRGVLLRKYMYDFIQMLAPHLDRRTIEKAHRMTSPEDVAQMFADVELPER
jgi:LysR family cys regulon transcriptional activator